jgi:hypothetical protein
MCPSSSSLQKEICRFAYTSLTAAETHRLSIRIFQSISSPSRLSHNISSEMSALSRTVLTSKSRYVDLRYLQGQQPQCGRYDWFCSHSIATVGGPMDQILRWTVCDKMRYIGRALATRRALMCPMAKGSIWVLPCWRCTSGHIVRVVSSLGAQRCLPVCGRS